MLSIDSGGNYHGYIGDLCRMGVLGEPDAELEDLLAEIERCSRRRSPRPAPARMGGDMVAAAETALKGIKNAPHTDFFAHGMGLITHEAPFLMTNHPVAYEGVDAAQPLEAGMVLSVETTMLHPTRGFIKLEDTVAITATGYEMLGDRGRGWNRAGRRWTLQFATPKLPTSRSWRPSDGDAEPVAGVDQGQVPAEALVAVVDGDRRGDEAEPDEQPETTPFQSVTWPAPRWPMTPASTQAMTSSATKLTTNGPARIFDRRGSMRAAFIQGLPSAPY